MIYVLWESVSYRQYDYETLATQHNTKHTHTHTHKYSSLSHIHLSYTHTHTHPHTHTHLAFGEGEAGVDVLSVNALQEGAAPLHGGLFLPRPKLTEQQRVHLETTHTHTQTWYTVYD